MRQRFDEDLDRDVGLDNARRHFAGAHLRVDEEIVKERINVGERAAGVIAVAHEVVLQRRGPVLAQWIHDRRRGRQPIGIRIPRLEHVERRRRIASALGSSAGVTDQSTTCAPLAFPAVAAIMASSDRRAS